jgi:hypothetical protein
MSASMLAAVRSALNLVAGSAVALNTANGAGRAFELLIMSNLTERLRRRGYTIWIRLSDGTDLFPGASAVRFFQRAGRPGPIPPASEGDEGPSAICFTGRKGGNWEIWNGIQFRGRSGGLHEFDLAIVPAEIGDALRTSPTGGVPFGHGWLSIECKETTVRGSADEMRAFVARLYDTTLLVSHARHFGISRPGNRIHALSVSRGEAQTYYYDENRKVFSAVARTSPFARGATAIAGYYNIYCYDDLADRGELKLFCRHMANWIDATL